MSLPNQELPVIAVSKEERPKEILNSEGWTYKNENYKNDLENWKSSVTTYPIKPGMETDFREFAEKYYSINIYPNSENIKQGIKLPENRVRIIEQDCGNENCQIGCSNFCRHRDKVAILLPEMVEETQEDIWKEIEFLIINNPHSPKTILSHMKSQFNLTRK